MDEFEDAEAVETVANRVTPVWGQVVADMEATAEEYREDGWTAVECHPGDVAAIADEDVGRDDARTGLDVLVPDDEFDTVADLVDGPGEFDEVDVFRAEQNGVVFFVAALENETAEAVVLVPAYYSVGSSESFVEMVRREGELRIHVRPLDRRRILTFAQTDPDLFLPESD
ncbi:DUF7529 family protein [Haloarchaeobius sp. HRN-SO-5]|uniref:DUF7529 family protein n=1 Tax=Haloarchaeobius sp. HRN-SO-5 TaxID=3446118 RepID=UPI003EBCEC07